MPGSMRPRNDRAPSLQEIAKILCALHDDPLDGYPKSYPRLSAEDRPLSQRPDVPDAKSVDFKPGAGLGSVGLRTYLGSPATLSSSLPTRGAEFPLRMELPETVISQPFWPAYLTAGRIAKAKRLKLAIAAGLGSDR